MVSGIACHVISHYVSFFCLSQSFFIGKEENFVFEYIGLSFKLYCSIILRYILPGVGKKRGSLIIVSLFAKSVSLFKKM